MYIDLKQAPSLDHYYGSHYHRVDEIKTEQFENELDELEAQSTTALPGVGPIIPEDVPILPIIASTNPIFPKFIRIIEIQDKKMIDLIMKNVELKFPYAGIFTRHDDSNESSLIGKDLLLRVVHSGAECNLFAIFLPKIYGFNPIKRKWR